MVNATESANLALQACFGIFAIVAILITLAGFITETQLASYSYDGFAETEHNVSLLACSFICSFNITQTDYNACRFRAGRWSCAAILHHRCYRRCHVSSSLVRMSTAEGLHLTIQPLLC